MRHISLFLLEEKKKGFWILRVESITKLPEKQMLE